MLVNGYEKKISVMFDVARVFALLSIVSAHLTFSASCPYIVSKLYSVIGSIGVIAFLIISGYYYNSAKYSNPLKMLRDKAIRLGIPWVVLGSFSYAYGRIMSGETVSIGDYLKYIVGDESFLYYLTVLVLCYLIFFRTNKIIQICSVIITVASLMLTASGLVDGYVSFMKMTNYLNVFNWIGIFALGMLLRKINAESMYKFLVRFRLFAVGTFCVLLGIVCYFNLPTGYFSYLGIWIELLGAFTIFSISTIKIFENKVFATAAELSFVVYLINIVANGVVNDIYNLSVITQALAGFIVTALCVFGFWVIKIISIKAKCQKIAFPILGINNRTTK